MNREYLTAEAPRDSWRFDRKISLSVCLSALGSLAAAAFLAAATAAAMTSPGLCPVRSSFIRFAPKVLV